MLISGTFLSNVNLTKRKVKLQSKQNNIFSGSIIKKKALYLIKSGYLFICLVKLLDEKSEFPLIRGIPPDLK